MLKSLYLGVLFYIQCDEIQTDTPDNFSLTQDVLEQMFSFIAPRDRRPVLHRLLLMTPGLRGERPPVGEAQSPGILTVDPYHVCYIKNGKLTG